MPRISVIIPVLYSQNLDRLSRVIGSVQKAGRHTVELDITVCMNALPPDGTVNVPEGVHVLSSQVNKGFSQAVNDGIVYAGVTYDPDWYLVLNDDVLLHRDYFVRLHEALHSQAYDALSCKVLTLSGSVESAGIRYGTSGLTAHRKTDIQDGELPAFSAVAVLLSRGRVRKEITRYGYVFHPFFFAYAEDLELSLRILKDGGSIFISNDPLLTHEGSHTAGRGSAFQLYYGYRNLILVVFFHWSDDLIRRNFPALLVGQIYILLMCLHKGYWLLWPKIWWWIVRNYRAILWQRNLYART